MNIQNFLTINEAMYRWNISRYQINKVLENDYIVSKYSKRGHLKGVKLPSLKKPIWILSEEFMLSEFGPEFDFNFDNLEKHC